MSEKASLKPDEQQARHDYPFYIIVSQHWVHAEQIRWTLLYNFLMASTILLLAWATIFASGPSVAKTKVMVLLCIAGIILSCIWIGLGLRSSSFVDMYAKLGQSEEDEFKGSGPFHAADKHRIQIHGLAAVTRSKHILFAVPIVFAVIYLILCYVSIG